MQCLKCRRVNTGCPSNSNPSGISLSDRMTMSLLKSLKVTSRCCNSLDDVYMTVKECDNNFV